MPILQCPDEPTHLNYALNIFSAGRLYSVREPYRKWNTIPTGRFQAAQDLGSMHVYTSYLMNATNFDNITFHYSVKVPPDYGTSEYYGRLDRGAPPEDSGELDGRPRDKFGLQTQYPFGYYLLLAAWLRAVSLFSKRLTVLFFAARLFSVVLLVINVLLIYATTREIRFSRGRSLMVTGITSLFPMTTFVSSSIQPDNLSLTMVLLSCYLALMVRRRFDSTGLLALLGLALGVLCVTKYHVYAAVLVPIVAMLVGDRLVSKRSSVGRARTMMLVMFPSILCACVQAWVLWDSHGVFILSDPNLKREGAALAASRGVGPLAAYLLDGFGRAFVNFYWNGSTFQSFWGTFGWMDTPLVILTPWKTEKIRSLIGALSVAVFCLTLLRLGQVLIRLLLLARRGRWREAASIPFSKPPINAYIVFTVMMFWLFAVVRYSYAPQGRNWFPFILPIFLVATYYAPRAVPGRTLPRILTGFLLATLTLYCLAGVYYSRLSVINRYYVNNPVPYSLGMQ